MNLGDKIRFLMKEKKLTTAKLARETKLPYTTIDSMLKRTNFEKVKISSLQVIKDYFDVSLDYLMSDDIVDKNYGKPISEISSGENALLEAYHQNPEMQPVIRKLLDIDEPIITEKEQIKTRFIEFYNLPVSAGNGVYLDNNENEMIEIPENEKTMSANFALRVRGDSMEPNFSDNNIILIKSQPFVETGQLGIFIMDNEGFFKKLGHNKLISINPIYPHIEFTKFDNLICKGLVLGKL